MSAVYILLLFVLSFVCSQGQVSRFEGRSGDIIIFPKNIQDNSVLLLVNKETTEALQIEETSVADLISHLVGGPVISGISSRDAFPASSVFDKSAANLLFVVDSFGSEILNDFPNLEILRKGKQIKLTKSAVPEDSVASLTTIATGQLPEVHGIVGKSWFQAGATASAYSANALPSVANLADIFSQIFAGKSLTVTSSAQFQLASAFGVHQFLNAENPFWNNLGFYYDSNTRTLESLYASTLHPALKLTVRQIVQALAANTFPLPTGASMSFDNQTKELIVDLPAHNVHAEFIVDNEILPFFFEIQFMNNLLSELKNDSNLNAAVADNIPDLFSFAFSSLKIVQNKYGKQSPQFAAAVYLVDHAMSQVISEFSVLYSGKVSAEIIFLAPSGTTVLQSDVQMKQVVFKLIRKSVKRDLLETTFPSIYVLPNANMQELCSILRERLPSDLQIDCTEFPTVVSTPIPDFVHIVNYSNTSNNSNGNNTGTPSNVATFQLGLWVPILLILSVIGAVYAIYAMDVGKDSLIFRQTIPKTVKLH